MEFTFTLISRFLLQSPGFFASILSFPVNYAYMYMYIYTAVHCDFDVFMNSYLIFACREKELARVVIKKEDVDLIVST